MGRSRIRGAPSITTDPRASVASAVKNRAVVPEARASSGRVGVRSRPPVPETAHRLGVVAVECALEVALPIRERGQLERAIRDAARARHAQMCVERASRANRDTVGSLSHPGVRLLRVAEPEPKAKRER